MLIKACLNGDRRPGEHPALPLSPAELAEDARRVVDAGMGALHVHPRRPDGSETLEAAGAAVSAVRAACPGVPVGVSTGAWIEPDVERRLALIESWGSLPDGGRPDFASVNLSEPGAPEVCAALFDAGIGVEAGLWSPEDAQRLLEIGIAERCTRLLIELVRERTAEEARETAREIEALMDRAGVATPRLLHGEGSVCWAMLEYGLERGYDVRVGLEDTLTMPDSGLARDNTQLASAARDLTTQLGKP